MTIDPTTARDLDDALHVRPLPNGHFEVGVHIADVSHFVRPNTALDKVAAERATTTYLVQRAYPMLPRLLCEELCSLNPAVERLAFSVTWEMDAEGNEVGERWFGKSVIRSCLRLTYDEAQAIIENKVDFNEAVNQKKIDGDHHAHAIEKDVRTLFVAFLSIKKKLIGQLTCETTGNVQENAGAPSG